MSKQTGHLGFDLSAHDTKWLFIEYSSLHFKWILISYSFSFFYYYYLNIKTKFCGYTRLENGTRTCFLCALLSWLTNTSKDQFSTVFLSVYLSACLSICKSVCLSHLHVLSCSSNYIPRDSLVSFMYIKYQQH